MAELGEWAWSAGWSLYAHRAATHSRDEARLLQEFPLLPDLRFAWLILAMCVARVPLACCATCFPTSQHRTHARPLYDAVWQCLRDLICEPEASLPPVGPAASRPARVGGLHGCRPTLCSSCPVRCSDAPCLRTAAAVGTRIRPTRRLEGSTLSECHSRRALSESIWANCLAAQNVASQKSAPSSGLAQ